MKTSQIDAAIRRAKEPPALPELTPPETKCLGIIHAMLENGETVSILAVAEEMQIGKSGAQRHMDALREKGRLVGPRVVGEWALTSAGKRQLEKKA